MKLARIALALAATTLMACGGSTEADSDTTIDVDTYRSVLPQAERLAATAPTSVTRDAGDARMPHYAQRAVTSVNGRVGEIANAINTIAAMSPASIDLLARKVTWGPVIDALTGGELMLVVQRNDPDTNPAYDFQYTLYRLAPLESGETALAAIVWGASTPNAYGPDAGVMVRDREVDMWAQGQSDAVGGRWVVTYGASPLDDGVLGYVVLTARGIPGADAYGGPGGPRDSDYFFGHYVASNGHELTFLDYAIGGDLCTTDEVCEGIPTDSQDEIQRAKFAFYDRGTGRAEAQFYGGDLTNPQDVVECWSPQLSTTYLDSTLASQAVTLGEPSDCGALEPTLAELGVPALEHVNPEVIGWMACVASTGGQDC